MGRLTSKAQFLTALQSITWTFPQSVQDSDNYSNFFQPKNKFGRIDSQMTMEEIAEDQFPYCRVYFPDITERRQTDGGDLGSYKRRDFEAHLFIYMAGFAKDWKALGDYFENIFDTVMTTFRHQGSPQPGVVSAVDNNHIVGWGLRMADRIEEPDLFGDAVSYRGTILVTTIEYVM